MSGHKRLMSWFTEKRDNRRNEQLDVLIAAAGFLAGYHCFDYWLLTQIKLYRHKNSAAYLESNGGKRFNFF